MSDAVSAPWNPRDPLLVSPEEYEAQVVKWLRKTGEPLKDLEISHRELVAGISGEYTLDGWATFQAFGGATFKILIECKRYRRPVEREVIMAIHSRQAEVAASKSIVFATSGFQRGALEYASKHGIALVSFIDGAANYFTRSAFRSDEVCLPPGISQFAGQLLSTTPNVVSVSTIDNKDVSALQRWLSEQ